MYLRGPFLSKIIKNPGYLVEWYLTGVWNKLNLCNKLLYWFRFIIFTGMEQSLKDFYQERIIQKCSRDPARECLLWGNRNRYVYIDVKFSRDSKDAEKVLIHRFMLFSQDIRQFDNSLEVSHICNMKNCANQYHLSLETHEANCGRKSCFFRGKCFRHGQYPDCLI